MKRQVKFQGRSDVDQKRSNLCAVCDEDKTENEVCANCIDHLMVQNPMLTGAIKLNLIAQVINDIDVYHISVLRPRDNGQRQTVPSGK